MIEELVISMLRLAKHEACESELKLLNRTCKELRNAWRVFRPFDNRRKIAIYGSARTSPRATRSCRATEAWLDDAALKLGTSRAELTRRAVVLTNEGRSGWARELAMPVDALLGPEREPFAGSAAPPCVASHFTSTQPSPITWVFR